jgi:hypothetical protein
MSTMGDGKFSGFYFSSVVRRPLDSYGSGYEVLSLIDSLLELLASLEQS